MNIGDIHYEASERLATITLNRPDRQTLRDGDWEFSCAVNAGRRGRRGRSAHAANGHGCHMFAIAA